MDALAEILPQAFEVWHRNVPLYGLADAERQEEWLVVGHRTSASSDEPFSAPDR